MNVAARGATAITAPSWYHKSRLPRVPRPYAARYLTHTDPRANVRALLSIRLRDTGSARKTSQGVAAREDYWFAANKSAEIFYREL